MRNFYRPPHFRWLFLVCLGFSVLLYLRHPSTNFIFDEQEALLRNPYLQGEVPWWQVFSRDFWGRLPAETIGSYRPLPNLLWRVGAWSVQAGSPFGLHLLNLVVHACVAALLGRLAWGWTRDERIAWWSSLVHVGLAVSTEAVSSVVGLADLLAGLFLVSSLLLIQRGLSWGTALLLGLVTWLGLLSKETMVVALPLSCLFVWLFTPREKLRTQLAFTWGAQLLAWVAWVEVRRRAFPLPEPSFATLDVELSRVELLLQAVRSWWSQPSLPIDPLNNPLVGADWGIRIATVLRVYASGLWALFFPVGLSGDYSLAQEEARSWSVGSTLGAVFFVSACVLSLFVLLRRRVLVNETTPPLRLALAGFLWITWAYLPVSNLLLLLPTIRADRLWYLSTLGAALLGGVCVRALLQRSAVWAPFLVSGLLSFQWIHARLHACDYADDLFFWKRTVQAAPRSAKARLNYGIMLGARGQTEARIAWTRAALEVAPTWPMAHVYLGDALCRSEQVEEAWAPYRTGFLLAPDQRSLIALGLQCLWDQGVYSEREAELQKMAGESPGSWLAYLVAEVSERGEEHGGVPLRYRPSGYNERSTDPLEQEEQGDEQEEQGGESE